MVKYSLTTKLREDLREEGCTREDRRLFAFAKKERFTESLSNYEAAIVERRSILLEPCGDL